VLFPHHLITRCQTKKEKKESVEPLEKGNRITTSFVSKSSFEESEKIHFLFFKKKIALLKP
jgi:hypothetical protein